MLDARRGFLGCVSGASWDASLLNASYLTQVVHEWYHLGHTEPSERGLLVPGLWVMGPLRCLSGSLGMPLGRLLGPLGGLWVPLGRLLGASGLLGSLLGGKARNGNSRSRSGASLGALLGSSWAVSGASWAVLEPSGAVMGPSWGPLGLGRIGAILRASWAVLDRWIADLEYVS